MNLLKNMQLHNGFYGWYAFCQLDIGSQVHGLKVFLFYFMCSDVKCCVAQTQRSALIAYFELFFF